MFNIKRSLLFVINTFLNDCPYPVVYRIEVWFVGRPHVWYEIQSHDIAAQSSCKHSVRWKVIVASSLTDVWQQLFEQQNITVIRTDSFSPLAA